MPYANDTNVSDDRSRQEIERLLLQYGADEFGYLTRITEAVIGFKYRGLKIEMSVPLPDRAAERFHRTPKRRQRRTQKQAFDAWRQEVNRRWRSLLLVVKAKLVAIEDEVTTFEAEFLPYIVCGDGETISAKLGPYIQKAIEQGGSQYLLPAGEKM